MSNLTVLYVDDDPDLREVAELSLQMDPAIEVRTAAGGAEALELLRAGEVAPDVVMLDVMMPGMDGPSVLERMRQELGPKAPRAVFITARALPAETERLTALGAVGVITKPFDPLTLAARLRRILDAA